MAAAAKEKKPSRKKNPGAKTGSPWRTRTWVGLTVIISIWMFIFGILVGRGTVPSQFDFSNTRKELYAQAEQADKAEKNKDVSGITEESITEPPPDSAKKTKKPNRDPASATGRSTQQISPKKEKKAPPEPVKKKEPPRKLTKKASPVKKVVSPKVNEKVKTKIKATEPPPKKSRKKTRVFSFQTIQVAAIDDINKAKQMVARLRGKGYPAYLASAMISGKGMIHRVRIGPYKTGSSAQNAMNRLKKLGINGRLLKGR